MSERSLQQCLMNERATSKCWKLSHGRRLLELKMFDKSRDHYIWILKCLKQLLQNSQMNISGMSGDLTCSCFEIVETVLANWRLQRSSWISNHPWTWRLSRLLFLGGLWCLMPLSTIFQLYRGGQFYWWNTRRKPLICRKSLTIFITMLHQVHLDRAGLEITTLVVIGADCIGNCKSNSHTITATTAPWLFLRCTMSTILNFRSTGKVILCKQFTPH